jgi:hypothetical protein
MDNYAVATPASIATATWYRLTGVWDGSMLAIYVGPQLAANKSISGAVPTSGAGQDFLIGDNAGHLAQATTGAFDDVRIYNRALSAMEVSDLYFATGGQ